jgi:hypothetical protein
MLAQMGRLVNATAALVRNANPRPREIFPACPVVVQAQSASKPWLLATRLSTQTEGDLALDAQVHLWIERNRRSLLLPNSAESGSPRSGE